MLLRTGPQPRTRRKRLADARGECMGEDQERNLGALAHVPGREPDSVLEPNFDEDCRSQTAAAPAAPAAPAATAPTARAPRHRRARPPEPCWQPGGPVHSTRAGRHGSC